MPRSVYSVVGRDKASGLNPMNLIRKAAASVLVFALVLLGSATMASAVGPTTSTVTNAAVTTTQPLASQHPVSYVVSLTTSAALVSTDVVNVTLPAGSTVSGLTADTPTGSANSGSCTFAVAANVAYVTPTCTTYPGANTTFGFTLHGVANTATVSTTTPTVSINGGFTDNAAPLQIFAATIANPVLTNPSNGVVNVTYTTNGSPSGVVTTYTVSASGGTVTTANNCPAVTNSDTGTATTHTCAVTGLTAGTSYTFTVTPSGGSDPAPAASTTLTPVLVTPVATVEGSGLVGVTFSPDGVATTYVVSSNPGGLTCTYYNGGPAAANTTQSCSISGLTNGQAYTFTVTPSGGGTTSTASTTNSVTPVFVLGAPSPTSLGATASGDMALVSFHTDGVATLYTVSSTDSTTSATLTATSTTGGTYTGAAPTIGATLTGNGITGTPVIATASAGAFTVSGGTITNTDTYTPSSTVGPGCIVGNATPPTGTQSCEVTGLVNSNNYTFTLTPSGNSTTALASTAAYTAITTFAAPSAVGGNQSAVVSFTANGAATTYLVTSYIGSAYSVAGNTCTVYTVTPPTGSQSCTVTGLLNGNSYEFSVAPTGGTDTSVASGKSSAVAVSGTLATPTVVNAGAGAQKITFTADGSATTYTVNSTAGGFSCVVANTSTVPTGSQSCTVTGLLSNHAYQYNVTPTTNGQQDALGSTVSGNSVAVTTLSVLNTPTLTSTSPTSVTVTFIPDGTATTYTMTSYIGSAYSVAGNTCTYNTTSTSTSSQSCTVTGLTAGKSYEFTVTPSGNGDTVAVSAMAGPITPGTALATPSVATAGSGAVAVTFTADGVDTTYTVNAYVGPNYNGSSAGSCNVANTTTPPSGSQTCTVTGLTNGKSYEFTVAPNVNTTATVSALSAAITASNALATPTVANAGAGNIKVTFVADGVATLYTVTGSPGGSCSIVNTTTPPTGSQSCTVTGLTNGTSYTFTVTPSGNSTASGVSAASLSISVGTTPLAAPSVAYAASGAIAVSFVADGVASTYTVNSASTATGAVNASCVVANSTTAPTGAQSCTVTGLTNGDAYTFTVTPSGNLTTSLVSPSSASILVAASVAPAAPTGVTAVGGTGTLTVSWTAPTNTGGSAITGYAVAAVMGNSTTTCGTVAATATTCTISGLAAGTYSVTVAAMNANGTGAASGAASGTVVAVVVIPPVRNLFATHFIGQAIIGKTVIHGIQGGGFYGQPRVTSNNSGTTVRVAHDNGVLLTVIVTTNAQGHAGWHTLTITLANGKSCKVNYLTVK